MNSVSPTVQGLLARWAAFVVRRRGTIVLTWIAAVIVLVALAVPFGGTFTNSFLLPGTESQKAIDLLKSRFPQQAGDSASIVFQAGQGMSDAAVRGTVERIVAEAAKLPGVLAVSSPYDTQGAISPDGRIAFATVRYMKLADQVSPDDVTKLTQLVDRSRGRGLTVEVGGIVVEQGELQPPGATEAIGLLAAAFIMLIAFGSVVAMGLPLATALMGLGVSFVLIVFSANLLDFPTFVTSFNAMIGIGVGIDYALLIVTRFREGLAAGLNVERSVQIALSTAGRSVLFAGSVVAIALLGLTAVGIPFVSAIGIGGAIVVAIAVIVALTLLPALLALAGPRVDRWRIPLFHASPAITADGSVDSRSIWYRLAATIQRRPLLWFAASLSLLLVLGVPFTRIHLGFSDAGNGSTALHSRRAYDLLSAGFGPGFNGPLTLVADTRGAASAAATLAAVRTAVAGWPGVAQVSPPIPNQDGTAAIMVVTPTTAPQDRATEALVHALRRQALPPVVAGSGATVYVAGPTAVFIDIGDRITARLPLFFAAVIGLSFLLLMTVFRSLVVALKAAVMNLLSIGASFGVLVAIFQWGWLANIVGVRRGPIETFLPMMLFAILFGLSMDYEVFLISRVREEYTRTHDNAASVAHGLTATARVITAAAAIMVVVFLAFVLSDQRVIKEFGVGLAAAIFVDATIVRLLLVPATMELLGDANWWLPRWLNRLLPRLDVDGGDVLGAAALPRVEPPVAAGR
jgi:RND superfamily putative drug exporter